MKPRHHSLLDRHDYVLVVVDMQEPLIGSVFNSELLRRNCALLVSAAALLEVPILSTTQNSPRLGGLVPEIDNLLPDSSIRNLDKMTFSCAADPPFMDALNNTGRNQVLLCGVETHICILQTALDLHVIDYSVHVAADAVSSRTEDNHRLGLDKMRDSGIIICPAEGAVMEMLHTADSPEFKSVLKLIK